MYALNVRLLLHTIAANLRFFYHRIPSIKIVLYNRLLYKNNLLMEKSGDKRSVSCQLCCALPYYMKSFIKHIYVKNIDV